jgi:hypothetical protein
MSSDGAVKSRNTQQHQKVAQEPESGLETSAGRFLSVPSQRRNDPSVTKTGASCHDKIKVARPTRFERVTFAFGARIVCFAEAIRSYPNARYDTEIQKEI